MHIMPAALAEPLFGPSPWNGLQVFRQLAKHIPVVSDAQLTKDQPDYIVIMAWHYAQPIAHILRHQMALKSKLVVPLPDVTIWEGDIPG